jgi:glycosyltransferase involved in cell wall biosynthesis
MDMSRISDRMGAASNGMNVCFFIAEMTGFGGTERAACSVANGVVDMACVNDVRLLALMGETTCRFDVDQRIDRSALFPARSGMTSRYLSAIARLRRYLVRNRIDTLIVVESTLCLFAIPAAMALRVRVVCWEHFNFGMDGGKRKRTVARHLAALLAADVVTLTERDKEAWRKKTVALARLHAIFNPVNPRQVDFPYDTGLRTVLAVGRLVEQKGFDLLLRSWAEVKHVAIAKEWNLIIVGDGEERVRLLGQIGRLGLCDSVSLHPATQAIHEHYRRSAIICCPSRYEGLPMVLIEASQNGIPIVAFDCPTGPAEIVDNGVSGILVPDGDVPALATALITVMSDTQVRKDLSAGARAAATRFSRDQVLAKWNRLLSVGKRIASRTAGGDSR